MEIKNIVSIRKLPNINKMSYLIQRIQIAQNLKAIQILFQLHIKYWYLISVC